LSEPLKTTAKLFMEWNPHADKEIASLKSGWEAKAAAAQRAQQKEEGEEKAADSPELGTIASDHEIRLKRHAIEAAKLRASAEEHLLQWIKAVSHTAQCASLRFWQRARAPTCRCC
jgi:hypothetical protein